MKWCTQAGLCDYHKSVSLSIGLSHSPDTTVNALLGSHDTYWLLNMIQFLKPFSEIIFNISNENNFIP